MNDELWEAEFRGFFWGEGTIGITYYRRGERQFFRPTVKINLRDDDHAVLEDIQRHLGGHIYKTKRPRLVRHVDGVERWSNPAIEWTVVNLKQVKHVYRILMGGSLPAKKRKDVIAFGAILDLLHGPGIKYTDAEKERIRELVIALREGKNYIPQQEGQVVSISA